MKSVYLSGVETQLQSKTHVPVAKVIKGREKDMIKNPDGAFVFKIDDMAFLDRFLIMGAATGSIGRNVKIAKESAKLAIDMIAKDPFKVITRVYELNAGRRVFTKEPSLLVLALAMCHMYNTNIESRRLASNTAAEICNTPYDISRLAEFYKEVAGNKGFMLTQCIQRWFSIRNPAKVAYQGVKYRSRNGWTPGDLLRVSHPKPEDEPMSLAMAYLTSPKSERGRIAAGAFDIFRDFEAAMSSTNVKEVMAVLERNPQITWEMIPTNFLNEFAVWNLLVDNIPMTALVRNLSRFAANGFFKNNTFKKKVLDKLESKEYVTRGGMHPFKVYLARYTFARGRGASSTWTPDRDVAAALDEAFKFSFDNLKPINGRFLIGIDSSASMTWDSSRILGGEGPVAREFASVLAYILARANNFNVDVGGFTARASVLRSYGTASGRYAKLYNEEGFTLLDLEWKNMHHISNEIQKITAGSTNCGAPVLHALRTKEAYDGIIIITDNDINMGDHPVPLMAKYRSQIKPGAKMVVITTQVCNYSVADPRDPLMLDVVGVDASGPEIVLDFIANH